MLKWLSKMNILKGLIILFVVIGVAVILLLGTEYLLQISVVNRIFKVEITENIKFSEMVYYFSQYLNVVVVGMLTLGLFYLAFKDYIYNYETKAEIEYVISNYIYVNINKFRTYFYIPVTFVNNSKKAGVINEIKMNLIEDGKNKKEYRYKGKFLVERIEREGGKFSMYDTEPYLGMPLPKENVLRKNIYFDLEKNENINITLSESYFIEFDYEQVKKKFKIKFCEENIQQINEWRKEYIDDYKKGGVLMVAIEKLEQNK